MIPYKLMVDLDGVLVDFNRGFKEAFGHTPDSSFWTAQKDKKYSGIKAKKGFWEHLPPMRDFDQLWGYIKNFHPDILTAYPEWDTNAKVGKWHWAQTHCKIPGTSFHCVARSNKKHYAMTNGKQNVLIDDYKKNIDEWTAAGGIGILHTTAINTIAQLKHIGFSK